LDNFKQDAFSASLGDEMSKIPPILPFKKGGVYNKNPRNAGVFEPLKSFSTLQHK
jgi:hypothetical protein